MKTPEKITSEDVSFESYIEYKFKIPNLYFDKERFKEILGVDTIVSGLEYFDKKTVTYGVSVKILNETLAEWGLTKEEFASRLALASNRYFSEVVEKINQSDHQEQKDLKVFIENGIKHQDVLLVDFSDTEYMRDFQDAVKETLADATFTFKGDVGMELSSYIDAQDLAEVLYLLYKGDTTKAYTQALSLDTCVREAIPDNAWEVLHFKNEIN
jgi:hypothetical protein